MTRAVSKALGHAVRKAAQPSDVQLAAINTYAVEPQTADSVYVRTAWAGHNAIDRDGEVIDDGLLMDIARTLVGKGLHMRHPSGWDGDSGPGIGRIFDASVVEMTPDEARAALREPGLRFPPGTETARLLEASFFIPRTDKHVGLIGDIDAGVAGDVSLGFRPGQRSDVHDEAGNKVAVRLHGPGEGYELSLVWLGAQPGARVHKAAGGGAPIQEEPDMELQLEFDALKASHKALLDKHDTIAKQADGLTAIKAALGDDHAALADAPADLAAAVKAGKAYLKDLVDGIVKNERLLGMTGDTEEDAAKAADHYAGMPAEKLAAVAKRLQVLVDAGNGEDLGGDPNAGKPPAGRAEKDAASADPTVNPMLNKSA